MKKKVDKAEKEKEPKAGCITNAPHGLVSITKDYSFFQDNHLRDHLRCSVSRQSVLRREREKSVYMLFSPNGKESSYTVHATTTPDHTSMDSGRFLGSLHLDGFSEAREWKVRGTKHKHHKRHYQVMSKLRWKPWWQG